MSPAWIALAVLVGQRSVPMPDSTSVAQPIARSTSAVLQSSPLGITELARSNRSDSVLRGIFDTSELQRMPVLRPGAKRGGPSRATTSPQPRGFGAQAFPANLGSVTLFQPKPTESLPLLYFGEFPSDAVPPTLTQSLYCKGDGKVTYSVDNKAFSINMAKTTEWIDTPGGGTEKVVEYGTSGFNGKSGMQYSIVVEFNPAASLGIQTGNLTIKEPKRTITVPLQGESFSKQLSVKIYKASASKTTLMPGESFEVTLTLDVSQNAPSQIFLAPVSVGTLMMGKQPAFLAKPGKTIQKVKVTIPPFAVDSAATSIAIGAFDSSNAKLLSSRVVSVAIQREWVEWNYKQTSGNQTVWGRFQLASTGEYIWNVEAYNSSWVYPDRFYHAACLQGQGKQGSAPGVQMQWKLPGRTDRFFWLAVGKMELNSWSSAKKSPLSVFLGVWNGNPWFSNELDLVDGVLDLTGIYQIGAQGLESVATTDKFEWVQKTKFKPAKVDSLKGWYK